MLIEIHMIQNHSPANLNRDDLGAPKTCYFGGVMRSRISSQCLKRSIRMSDEFKDLCGGIRTRQLARLITDQTSDKSDAKKRAEKILGICGFKPKKAKKQKNDEDEQVTEEKSAGLVYTTREAIREMASLLQNGKDMTDEQLVKEFVSLISTRVAVPDIALTGRMLEPNKEAKELWNKLNTNVEAALQAAHAISTHKALPEVDYYVAADDIPGEDSGAGYLDEAMFASACFYKYFSISWETLIKNLDGYGKNKEQLAAHTVGAFIRAAALANPSGKQNSFAAHNPPDGILIEIKNSPISYANAFANPVPGMSERDVISQSIAQLGQYIHDIDTGYGKPDKRFWFSPNLRYPLVVMDEKKKERNITDENIKELSVFVSAVVKALGHDWDEVQKEVVNSEVSS